MTGHSEKLMQLELKVDEHIIECREEFRKGERRFDKLISCQEANTAAITSLVEETRDVIQLHRDLQGAARVGKRVQGFMMWFSKWPVIGVGLYAIYTGWIKLAAYLSGTDTPV